MRDFYFFYTFKIFRNLLIFIVNKIIAVKFKTQDIFLESYNLKYFPITFYIRTWIFLR